MNAEIFIPPLVLTLLVFPSMQAERARRIYAPPPGSRMCDPEQAV